MPVLLTHNSSSLKRSTNCAFNVFNESHFLKVNHSLDTLSQIISPAIYLRVFLTVIPTVAINPDNHPLESKLCSVGSIYLFFQALQIPREKKKTKRKKIGLVSEEKSSLSFKTRLWVTRMVQSSLLIFLQSCSTCAQVQALWVGYWSHRSEKTLTTLNW